PTPTLSATQFGERPLSIGPLTDRGLDRNGNGKFDDIEVDTPLLVTRSCEVRIVSRATDPLDSTIVSEVDSTFEAESGAQTVHLALPGTNFVLYSADGPFNLSSEVQTSGFATEVSTSTSQAYLVGDFDGAAVAPLFSNGFHELLDTDEDGQMD